MSASPTSSIRLLGQSDPISLLSLHGLSYEYREAYAEVAGVVKNAVEVDAAAPVLYFSHQANAESGHFGNLNSGVVLAILVCVVM